MQNFFGVIVPKTKRKLKLRQNKSPSKDRQKGNYMEYKLEITCNRRQLFKMMDVCGENKDFFEQHTNEDSICTRTITLNEEQMDGVIARLYKGKNHIDPKIEKIKKDIKTCKWICLIIFLLSTIMVVYNISTLI